MKVVIAAAMVDQSTHFTRHISNTSIKDEGKPCRKMVRVGGKWGGCARKPAWGMGGNLQKGQILGPSVATPPAWIQHPLDTGIPCCPPLRPTFVDSKAPLPGPAVGPGPRWAWARVLTLGLTRDPYRWVRQGGLRVNKSGSQGLTT